MTRYYLIPFEKERPPITPKYRKLFPLGSARGQIAKELPETAGKRTWLREYFVVRITTENSSNFDALDEQLDVVDITPGQKVVINKEKLEALGIDLSGIDPSATSDDIEKRLYEWLLEQDKKTADVFVGR